MFAIRCKECGSIPKIDNDNGIGDVYCEKCRNGISTNKYHFSGKFRKKSKAIINWNHDNKPTELAENTIQPTDDKVLASFETINDIN